jgi:anti-anti-sigma factor
MNARRELLDGLHTSPNQNRTEFELATAAVAIVSLVGEHDLAQSAPLKQTLELAAASRRHLVVDCSRCELMGSTAVELLLSIRSEVAEYGGQLGLVVPRRASLVRRVVQLLALESTFAIHPSRESAIAAVTGSGSRGRATGTLSGSHVAVPAGPDDFSLEVV